MKKQLFISALGVIIMTSCADTFDQNFEVGRPDMDGQYDYLKEYAPLKDCMAETVGAGFHLGIGTTVDDYMKQETVYTLTNSNFNETVAGNAMKMASCVGDDGVMDFAKVTSYVNMATDAGLSVFGHTLAWHSQQPNKWLKSLIANKELDIDPSAKEEKTDYDWDFSTITSCPGWNGSPETVNFSWGTPDGLKIVNPTSITPFYNLQYHAANGLALIPGTSYKVRMTLKAEGDAPLKLRFKFGDWGGGSTGEIDVVNSSDFHTVEADFTAADIANQFLLLQHGDFVGTLTIKNITVSHMEDPVVEMEQEIRMKTYEDGPFPFYPMGCEPPVINGAIHFVPTGDWSQFFCLPGGENTLTEGDYVMYLDLQSDKDATGIQFTIQNGWGGDAQSITASISVKAGRHTYQLKFPGVTGGNYDCILKPQTAGATLDLYSVTVKQIVKLNSIPLTPEEKKDTLIWAMDKWIGGMMAACDSKVKAWDVVNEAVSGGNPDSEGVFALQHSEGYNPGGTWDVGGDAFYWQDFMGDIDYVRTAVALARKHYEANGGTPADLKLFVNDYNLESDWDDNGKVKSLIKWIERWEADGVTKIDGIGTQMHISCYMNPQTQESKKKHITKMFELIAASGKLCRVSELDMGLVDADGNKVSTANVTEEQHKAMAEMYKFVVSEYLRIIPAAQQWGICQWCATDSPAGSGWRANEPVGLWDSNYYRKHTYAGFADGLSGK